MHRRVHIYAHICAIVRTMDRSMARRQGCYRGACRCGLDEIRGLDLLDHDLQAPVEDRGEAGDLGSHCVTRRPTGFCEPGDPSGISVELPGAANHSPGEHRRYDPAALLADRLAAARRNNMQVAKRR